jgi:alkanesulfonate monooxygenase
MTTRFHLSVPTAAPGAPPHLPGFITDVRPRPTLREQYAAAHAARLTGLDGVHVPFDPDGLESLVTAGGLLREAAPLEVTAEFHPAVASPVYAAKLTASAQRYSGSRLGWRLLVDLDPAVARAHGDFLPAADRYPRAAEFLTIARGVWAGRGYTYEGRFFQVLDGGFPPSRQQPQFPRVYLSGRSDQALALSAAHADVHVLAPGQDRGALPDNVAAGLDLTVLAREDDGEAERAARRAGLDGSAGALTGSYDRVADALAGYAAQGISEFFLRVPDPVTDGYLVGQHVLPLLQKETSRVG